MKDINIMKKNKLPVILDATHCLQRPNLSSGVSGGNPEFIATMCYAGIASGADGLFIEAHPDPVMAQSDSSNMLKLDLLEGILEKCIRLRGCL